MVFLSLCRSVQVLSSSGCNDRLTCGLSWHCSRLVCSRQDNLLPAEPSSSLKMIFLIDEGSKITKMHGDAVVSQLDFMV